ncbi:aromatic-L-amino-acid decarboxylase [Dongia mobilis]|uniref:Aromatic-L-amino-acid decarboxylase n=1 Tax=Dongia mobilis TaxID=578943 RepID=A0A4R6WP97_9PROT|nr:pyridoxal-dependent decarboxylase [Dongia mobilis]TDQ83014.1 aromatic-L-amino-acid decarboxylase [Dongia mobilis]
MTPEEFRQIGHALIDWIADYRANLRGYPVMSQVAPGDIKARLPTTPPQQAESLDNLVAEIGTAIMPGISHWQHPSFCAYFPANAHFGSVLGDLASAGLGVVGVSWQSSPALTEVEEVVTDWVRQMLGLPEGWLGAIEDSASIATLVALLCARERATNYSAERGGLQAEAKPLVVYGSEQSHSSVDKAALLAGFGRDNIRHVATDGTFAMDPDALRRAIAADIAAGRKPCAIVATTGTTATTAMDPIGALAVIAREHGLWLHVDAAMAGAAMVLPECCYLWAGIEQADSVVINGHKWLGVNFDCSLFFVKQADALTRVMSTSPSYLRTSSDDKVRNLRDWGLPLGRRFRAMKLWLMLREEGVAGIQARIRRDLAMAQWLKRAVERAPDWRVVAPVPLQTVCVRHEPDGLAGEALDQHTLTWAERINRSGRAYVTPAQLQGRWMVRLSLGSSTTEQSDVEALWQTLQWSVAE